MDIASAPGTQQRHLAKSYLARVMAEAGDVGSIRAGDNSCIHRRLMVLAGSLLYLRDNVLYQSRTRRACASIIRAHNRRVPRRLFMRGCPPLLSSSLLELLPRPLVHLKYSPLFMNLIIFCAFMH